MKWVNNCTKQRTCLFVLRLNVPVNNFSVMSGRSQRFLGLTSRELMCLAQGHNTVPLVGIEPKALQFGVQRSTTTPPHSLGECGGYSYTALNPHSILISRDTHGLVNQDCTLLNLYIPVPISIVLRKVLPTVVRFAEIIFYTFYFGERRYMYIGKLRS